MLDLIWVPLEYLGQIYSLGTVEKDRIASPLLFLSTGNVRWERGDEDQSFGNAGPQFE